MSVVDQPAGDLLNPMEMLKLAQFRRSIRGFQRHRDVPDEVLETILETARWAPSGGNAQPWEFIVIRDAELRNRIADLYMRQLEEKKEIEKAVRGYTRMPGDGFRHAPVFVLVIGDPRVAAAYPIRTQLDKGERHFITGLANVTLLIQLAAASFGLGSQYVSDAGSPYLATMLKVLLGIPEPYRVYELVPIGYPIRWPGATPRRTLAEMVHRERFDPAKYRNDDEMKRYLFDQTRVGAYGKSKSAGRPEEEQSDLAPEDER